jgi:hypothetical protein
MGSLDGHGFTLVPRMSVVLSLLAFLECAWAFQVGPVLLRPGFGSQGMAFRGQKNQCQAHVFLPGQSDALRGFKLASPWGQICGEKRNGRHGRISAMGVQMKASPSSVDITEAKVFEESTGGMFKKVVMEMEVRSIASSQRMRMSL